MTEEFTGGCLCGALRYTVKGAPMYAGCCYCDDCRKASGSGFIPFIGVARGKVAFTGRTLTYRSRARRGGDAVRNSCAVCGGLVFGGEAGISDSFTIYAGSLDDPTRFHPSIAIFARNCPGWVVIPPGLKVFAELPPQPE
jgi:hypothetical protein